MTTLYRTPNVIIDRCEWHAIVLLLEGRVSLVYRWRSLSARPEQWQPITTWQGPKPKGIGDTFWRFRGHIREAMESEQARAQALAGAPRTQRGTLRKIPDRRVLPLASVA